MCLPGKVRQLPAGHTGHHHIGEQEIDTGALSFEKPQCRRSVMGLDDAITQVPQAIDGIGTDVIVVFHDEDAFLLLTDLKAPRDLSGFLAGPAHEPGQVDLDRGPLLFLRIDLHMAARLLDETVNH